MKLFKLFALPFLGLGLVVLQVTWLQSFFGVGIAIHLPLLFLLVIASRTDLSNSLLLAFILGLAYQLFSVLPAWIHPTSLILATLSSRFIRRRLATNRTSTGLIVSVSGGTAVYYAATAVFIISAHVLHDKTLIPLWSVWITAVIWQVIIHPILAGFWWIFSRQRRAALHVGSW